MGLCLLILVFVVVCFGLGLLLVLVFEFAVIYDLFFIVGLLLFGFELDFWLLVNTWFGGCCGFIFDFGEFGVCDWVVGGCLLWLYFVLKHGLWGWYKTQILRFWVGFVILVVDDLVAFLGGGLYYLVFCCLELLRVWCVWDYLLIFAIFYAFLGILLYFEFFWGVLGVFLLIFGDFNYILGISCGFNIF